MKRIVVACDGSPGAERAVRFAAEQAFAHAAELIILTVIDQVVDKNIREFSRAEGATIGDIVEAKAQAVLHRARTIAEEAGARLVKTETLEGDPAEMILDLSNQVKADLVVLGKRGRGRLKGLLLGSVSQKLVELADCAVAIVP